MIAHEAITESGCCIFRAEMDRSGARCQFVCYSKHKDSRYHGKVRGATDCNSVHAHGCVARTRMQCTFTISETKKNLHIPP